jgi:MSHA biogenesis protein MshQ
VSFAASTAFAQPVWQSSQTAVGTGNATVTKPASTASGDLLIVGLMVEKGSGETITAPAGWNLIRRTNESTNVGMATYYKVAGGAEPANYTFTIANGSKWAIGISRITGADTSDPIDVHGGQTGSGSSVTAPSVTTTAANDLVLAFYTNKKAATYTPAGTTTERYDVPNSSGGLPSNMMASFVQTSAGATGNRNATASESEAWVGQQVAIQIPAPPSTKLYFHNATTPNLGTLPAATTLSATTPNVTAAGAGTNRDMDETIGTAQVSAALTTLGQTGLQRNWFRRFLSRPLEAQTLPTGVWTIQGAASESNAESNMLPWGAVIEVWRPSTGATVATLLDNPVLGTVEPGTGQTNISSSTGSIAGVAVNEGDILVVELWAENTQGGPASRTNTIFYDGTTEGSTTSNAAFLRAPGLITFHRSLRQSAYRLFNNANSTDVGTPLAAQDTAATLGSTGAAFRLRMLVHVADIDLGISGQAFKLQFVDKGTGTCAAPAGGTPAAYTDVTAATVIAYNNNAAPADGAALTANAADPTHGADTVVNQTYEELNDFTNSAAIIKARDGKWDFSLKDNGAPGATTFCLRAVKSTGTPLDTYLVFPEITTAAGGAMPGSFNAFETSTVANAIAGIIKTKVAGAAFSLDVVAIESGAQQAGFTDAVIVELLGNNTVGVALDAQNCPTSFTLVQTVAPDPTITGGRSTVSFAAVPNSWRDVRVRVRWPTTSPTVTYCSTDNFAIRPNTLASFAVSDADWETAGTGRALDDATFGALVHKAGRPVSVRASAVNAAGTPAVTANYAGTPTATLSACAGAACTPAFGALTLNAAFAAGQLVTDVATYDNVGAFRVQLADTDFAVVDAGDGSTLAERSIVSAAIDVGRFVPDHFTVALNTPEFGTACSGFGYLGQRFTYTTPPVVTVTARNFGGNPASFYEGAWWRLTNTSLAPATQAGRYSAAGAVALDLALLPGTNADPVVAASGAGVGTLTFSSGTGIAFNRTTPVAPFDAEIALAVDVIDADGVAYAGNPAQFGAASAGNGIAFDDGKAQRFGRLRLQNAYGPESFALRVGLETQYWNGSGFVRNAQDGCTSLNREHLALGSYTQNLNACETAVLEAGVTLSGGLATLTLAAAGTGNGGTVVLTPVLGAVGAERYCPAKGGGDAAASSATRAYLQGKWTGGTWNENPSARAGFGLYGSQPKNFIFFRENY